MIAIALPIKRGKPKRHQIARRRHRPSEFTSRLEEALGTTSRKAV
ncbi:MAG: hypothetical protein V7K53_27940 [Nostoc sp.]